MVIGGGAPDIELAKYQSNHSQKGPETKLRCCLNFLIDLRATEVVWTDGFALYRQKHPETQVLLFHPWKCHAPEIQKHKGICTTLRRTVRIVFVMNITYPNIRGSKNNLEIRTNKGSDLRNRADGSESDWLGRGPEQFSLSR